MERNGEFVSSSKDLTSCWYLVIEILRARIIHFSWRYSLIRVTSIAGGENERFRLSSSRSQQLC